MVIRLVCHELWRKCSLLTILTYSSIQYFDLLPCVDIWKDIEAKRSLYVNEIDLVTGYCKADRFDLAGAFFFY